jgi:hypothetical protein
VPVYPAYVILDLTALMILGEECKVRIFFHHPITSSLSGSNILLTILFLDILIANMKPVSGRCHRVDRGGLYCLEDEDES